MRIGAHVSVQGNYEKMYEYAKSVGCECAQIFAKNAKQYRYSKPKPERLSQMSKVHEEDPGFAVYSHTAYLINLSSLDPEIRGKSTEALAGELALASMFGLAGVNTHVGNDKGKNETEAAERAADSIRTAHDRADDLLASWVLDDGLVPAARICEDGLPAVPPLILEDAAGAGDLYGCTISQLSDILDIVWGEGFSKGDARLGTGICIDTCHAWAQGYDVSSAAGWDKVLDEVDERIGLDHLLLIHANDSKFGMGEHKDRHEWVGEGCIGPEGFSYIMSCGRASCADVILEVPGEVPYKDERNIEVLKEMRDSR
ncbi:MAG: deoxyribonuclease IV [Coriobacteriales bacterium]|jgi:deoxyribonuclease-4